MIVLEEVSELTLEDWERLKEYFDTVSTCDVCDPIDFPMCGKCVGS